MYRVTCFEKTATVDDYKEGCAIDSTLFRMDWNDTKETLAECIESACEFSNTKVEDILFDAECQDYLSLCACECADGTEPSPNQYEQWKRGELKLYCCDYVFEFEHISDVAKSDVLAAIERAKSEATK